MTQGRFDTTFNCRHENWDTRRHWTNWHHDHDCEKDHQERESCPFHDLRAGGQFQYEYWGSGVGGVTVEPNSLVKRSDAKHMVHGLGKGPGIGGSVIPCDTEPGRTQVPLKRSVDGRPWGGATTLKNGLFSAPGYIPQEGETGLMKSPRKLKAVPPAVATPVKAGTKAVPFLHKTPEYISDPYDGKVDRGRIYHFKAGVPKPIEDSRIIPAPCPPPEKPQHAQTSRPFFAGKKLGGTFNGPTEVLPEPYDFGKIKNDRRPLHTWHTHTKWSEPVAVPWSTGKATAVPLVSDRLGLTLGQAPCLANTATQHTIGKEAALTMYSPVTFKTN